MILDERVARVAQNLGFKDLAEWCAFWAEYNTRSGDFGPYGPKDSTKPTERLELIMRAVRGERIDLRALSTYRIETEQEKSA